MKPKDHGDDTFPQPPQIDLQKSDKEQAVLRLKYARGQRFERPNAIISEMQGIPKEDLSPRQISMYGAALAEVGKFQDAYTLTKDKSYKQIWDGLNTTPKPCRCKDWESVELIDGVVTPVKFSRMFIKKEIWNPLTGDVAFIHQCNKCGSVTI